VQTAKISTWIFQANPDYFDINGYLAAAIDRITWIVVQNATHIRIGDLVYIWRSAGRNKAVSGIIASARVDSEVMPGSAVGDPEAFKYWESFDTSKPPEPFVWLRLLRTASSKEMIKAKWLKEDPICRDLGILKMPQKTNYPLAVQQAERLDALWQATGVPWSYAECVAALKVYAETKGQEISRLSDSPVSTLAMQLGRAIGGAYNKLMNFRAIDPTDDRKGLSSVAIEDRKVWEAFFDSNNGTIRTDLLEGEYDRLWGSRTLEVDEATLNRNQDRHSDELASRSLADLQNVIIEHRQTSRYVY